MGLNEKWTRIVERRGQRRRQSSGTTTSSTTSNANTPLPTTESSQSICCDTQFTTSLNSENSKIPNSNSNSHIVNSSNSNTHSVTTRRVSFPNISPSFQSPRSPSTIFNMRSDAESDTISLSPRSFGSSGKTTSDFSAWFSRKINGILGEKAETSSVVSILTRTLSKATAGYRKKKRECSLTISSFESVTSEISKQQRSWFHSESQLLDLFLPETSYHAECRAIADKYGLIVDLDDDEMLTRIVEGALEMDDAMYSPISLEHKRLNISVSESNEAPIDFIDADAEGTLKTRISRDGCQDYNVFGLPDHISRMVSPSDHSHASSSSSNGATNSMNNLYSQLDRLYGKHDLFGAEEYQSWHEKYRHNTLSTKQVKKQDAIFELYLMEKRHCANIAFLLQGYRRRMLDESIISKQDMDILIPDVLEPLLIFHLNVLERITARIQENYEVGTISDIISEELAIDGGQHTKLCCDAYTDFGVAKERSDVLYHHLMNKNAKFAEFFKRTYVEEPFYKHYDFRPLITKIIGRATKYSLLLETILKNEQPFSEYHDLTKLALETARKFAHKIDENLSMAHMSMKWEEIKVQIDPSSTTNLYVSDPSVPNGTIRYNFDLESLNSATNRKLVHLGEALIKIPNLVGSGGGTHSSSSSGKTTDKKDQCWIVLFDDIIVILIRKSSRQLVFMHDQGAMPVQSLLIRTAARGHSIMLISGAKPVLFEISFNTSTDRKKWVAHLEAAPKNVPPEGIRITTGDADGVLRDRVAAQQELEDKWLKRLEELFDSRLPEEEALSKYLETRLNFFDDLRDHVSKLPFKSRTDISNRIREAVKSRFRELRRSRVIPLNRLVERMSESRDADLWSYFDEKADASDVLEKSSDLSEDSDSGDSVAGNGRTKPRRIQTFHGTSQPLGSNGINDSKNNGIRRHTTVPRMNSEGGSASNHPTSSSATDRAIVDEVELDDDDVASSQMLSARGHDNAELDRKAYGAMISELPIRQTMRARRASTKLIKEVISLRRENHLLRNDNALTKSRCALLERVRGGGAMMSSTATAVDESMEMLRKKEKEIREMQRQMLAEKEELLEKQKAVESQEQEIQSKWAALQSRSMEQQAPVTPLHTRSISSHSNVSSPTYKTPQPLPMSSSQNGEWSPVLASLATKTETKKLKK
ncbi:hypothetical protein CRE_14240 [Caenorhabditis remanei]|uniref:DH domain-containing protein n=1 Tax=Caenorhabditis remanei TaxID=31234 RepID=E3N1N8_CAERE|nr:hypothetical protein CRE_14240 [Caenorhabditis remanei]